MEVTTHYTGGTCPACGGGWDGDGMPEFGQWSDGTEYVYARCTCNECGKRFVNVYTYSHTETYDDAGEP